MDIDTTKIPMFNNILTTVREGYFKGYSDDEITVNNLLRSDDGNFFLIVFGVDSRYNKNAYVLCNKRGHMLLRTSSDFQDDENNLLILSCMEGWPLKKKVAVLTISGESFSWDKEIYNDYEDLNTDANLPYDYMKLRRNNSWYLYNKQLHKRTYLGDSFLNLICYGRLLVCDRSFYGNGYGEVYDLSEDNPKLIFDKLSVYNTIKIDGYNKFTDMSLQKIIYLLNESDEKDKMELYLYFNTDEFKGKEYSIFKYINLVDNDIFICDHNMICLPDNKIDTIDMEILEARGYKKYLKGGKKTVDEYFYKVNL